MTVDCKTRNSAETKESRKPRLQHCSGVFIWCAITGGARAGASCPRASRGGTTPRRGAAHPAPPELPCGRRGKSESASPPATPPSSPPPPPTPSSPWPAEPRRPERPSTASPLWKEVEQGQEQRGRRIRGLEGSRNSKITEFGGQLGEFCGIVTFPRFDGFQPTTSCVIFLS